MLRNIVIKAFGIASVSMARWDSSGIWEQQPPHAFMNLLGCGIERVAVPEDRLNIYSCLGG